MAKTSYFKDLSGEVWSIRYDEDNKVWFESEFCGYVFNDMESGLEFMKSFYGDFQAYFGEIENPIE